MTPTERERFMQWLRSLPGFALTPEEADKRWRERLRSRDAAERYRRNVGRHPDHPRTEEHD